MTSVEGRKDLYDVLHGSLTAATRDSRSPVATLLSHLTMAASWHTGTSDLPPGANVVDWEPSKVRLTRVGATPTSDQFDSAESMPRATPPPIPSWTWFDEAIDVVLDHPWRTVFTVVILIVLISLIIF